MKPDDRSCEKPKHAANVFKINIQLCPIVIVIV